MDVGLPVRSLVLEAQDERRGFATLLSAHEGMQRSLKKRRPSVESPLCDRFAAMKRYLIAISVLVAATAQGQSLQKIWETDTLLKTPESVLYAKKEGVLFVSNIDGKPGEKDGKGSIGKVGPDGKILAAEWVKGLNAPKGMGLHKGILYVADLTEVVAIDVKKAAIVQKIPVDGAVFLNDIAIDDKGAVYVSDTKAFKVHKIVDGKADLFLDKLERPNGLLCDDGNVYLLDNGSLYKIAKDKNKTKLAEGMDPSTDGIEKVKEGEFIVSCWAGITYYVKANGDKKTLFDNRDKKLNSADIGYNAKEKMVYVPTFYANKVAAYRLEE